MAIKIISDGHNHTSVDVGKPDEISGLSMIHPVSGKKVEGKIFLKDLIKSTGSEISFNSLPAHSDLPYFHSHRKNEEIYIILSGSGDFQVDDKVFRVGEGSVVRVAPGGNRGMRNTSDRDMIYLVIQTRDKSLEEYSSNDGQRHETTPLWK